MYITKWRKNMIEDDRPIRICPKCGSIVIARKGEECDTCDLEWDKLILTNYTYKIRLEMDKEQKREWEEMLRKRYVLCPDNPYYDKKAWDRREDIEFQIQLQKDNWEKKRNAEVAQSQSHQLICPKCGSTNFTPVPRKWSLLTGFMTNKVDMVCNQCGHVVKK